MIIYYLLIKCKILLLDDDRLKLIQILFYKIYNNYLCRKGKIKTLKHYRTVSKGPAGPLSSGA